MGSWTERPNRQTDEQANGCRQTGREMDGWLKGQADRQMNGWVFGQTDRGNFFYFEAIDNKLSCFEIQNVFAVKRKSII